MKQLDFKVEKVGKKKIQAKHCDLFTALGDESNLQLRW